MRSPIHARTARITEPAIKPEALRFMERDFPKSAGILLGLGLGGFFDGIVLHQLLQWHHMLTSAGFPADSIDNLEFNTLWDGIFHLSTYVFVVLGLLILWKRAHRDHVRWSGKLLVGTILMGFGIFNLVEGIIDHHLLNLHHVRDMPVHFPTYDWVFLGVGGLGFLVLGWSMMHPTRLQAHR